MISLTQIQTSRFFAFILVAIFLFAEFAVVQHAIDHSFQDPDEYCVVCEKADNFQKTLIVAIGLLDFSAAIEFEPDLGFASRFVLFHRFFFSRAPPKI